MPQNLVLFAFLIKTFAPRVQSINRIQTTEDIDFVNILKKAGMDCQWENSPQSWMGINWKVEGGKVLAEEVEMDGTAYKLGIQRGDELVEMEGQKVMETDFKSKWSAFPVGKKISFVTSSSSLSLSGSRPGSGGLTYKWEQVELSRGPLVIKKILVKDEKKFEQYFKGLLA